MSDICLTTEHRGYGRLSDNPPGCIELLNGLLQKNHDQFDVFWKPVAGHNHTVHSMLSVYALGGTPEDLQRAYDDDDLHQAPLSAIDEATVQALHDPEIFLANMCELKQYGNYLRFFEQEIASKGWKAVVSEYLFSRTPVGELMFSQLWEGAYHPIIHLGFGIEFDQPSIVAEGLAQCATHDAAGIQDFFVEAEQLAQAGGVSSKPLLKLYREVRETEQIKTAAKMTQGPVRVRDGVMASARHEIAAVASHFQVAPGEVRRGLVEMTSCAALSCGGAQRAGKGPKIDFFYMHNVNCSLFVNVMVDQDWISLEDKARLVEWKGRMDLVWYAASSAPDLDAAWVESYQPTASKGLDWRGLYAASCVEHDDGHLTKFIRAMKCAADAAEPFAAHHVFPVRGDMHLKVAQMAYDSTVGLPIELKWLMGAGFDPLWARVPDV